MSVVGNGSPRGRHKEAARNDARIFEAARRVLTVHPDAPVSAVGAEAGVGKSALYRRYPSKERLLQAVAEDLTEKLVEVIVTAHGRLDRGEPGADVLAAFLAEAAETEVHTMMLAITGRFETSARDRELSAQGWRLGEELTARLHASGVLREHVGWLDLNKLLEGLCAVRSPQAGRTSALRGRFAVVFARGLASADDDLPGGRTLPADFGALTVSSDPGTGRGGGHV